MFKRVHKTLRPSSRKIEHQGVKGCGSFKNSAAELNWNQRTRRTSREVTDERGGSKGKGDNTERRVGTERRGLRAGGLQDGELREIKDRTGRESLDSGDKEQQRGRRWSRRTGESICYNNVLGAREVNEGAGKLRDEGQLPLLPC